MTSTQLKAQIDAQITNETVDEAITQFVVGGNMKDIVDYVDNSVSASELRSNKSTSIVTDGGSDVKYPSVKAVKTYVDAKIVISGSSPAKTSGDLAGGNISTPTNITYDINNLVVTTNGVYYYKLPAATVGKEFVLMNNSPYSTQISPAPDEIIRENRSELINGGEYITNLYYVHQGKRVRITCNLAGQWDVESFYSVTPRVSASATADLDNANYSNTFVYADVTSVTVPDATHNFIQFRQNPTDNGYLSGYSMIVINTSATIDLKLMHTPLKHYQLLGIAPTVPYVIAPNTITRFTLEDYYWIAEKINY